MEKRNGSIQLTGKQYYREIQYQVSILNCLLIELYLTESRGIFYSLARERGGLSNELEPVAGMRPDDADLAFMSLLTSVVYQRPVHDPWFLALKEMTAYDSTSQENNTVYLSNSPVTAMGCTIQVS